MITARVPLRITLGGGGTDLPSYYRKYGGFLVAAAIKPGVSVSARERPRDLIVFRGETLERVRRVKDLRHPIVKEALRSPGFPGGGGIEITSSSKVPSGTGLGSSGSFTAALLLALQGLRGKRLSNPALAQEACRLSLERLKESVGKQDPYACAVGGLRAWTFHRGGAVSSRAVALSPVRLKELERRLLLFYTGLRRSAADILAGQDLRSRRGDAEMIENLHGVKRLGRRSLKALESGDLRGLGALFDEQWAFKTRRSPEATNPRIELWLRAGKAAGAWGGKLVGAGGGGFLLFLCENPSRVRRAMASQGLRELKFRFDFEGARILP